MLPRKCVLHNDLPDSLISARSSPIERNRNLLTVFLSALVIIQFLSIISLFPRNNDTPRSLDERVKKFLEERKDTWRDMNVPETDGKLLHNLIIKNKYSSALEIGTSTGHSGIWMAWALSKTGGKLTTIEIDKERYREAVANFREAGLSDFIDARLGDAHELVKELDGPFDFVFCDADKGWYIQYFNDILPKLKTGGCYTAHNVSSRSWSSTRKFYEFIINHEQMETTFDNSGSGLSISYKKLK